MSRPSVLHVYKDYFPPVVGGIENTINLMARGTLDEFDVRVLVCSGSRRSSLDFVDGVEVRRVGELARFSSAPVSLLFPLELRRAARAADILHFHHPNPTGDIACLLARPRAPIVMTYHSDIVRQRYSMLLFGPVQDRMMKACSAIMPTSPNYVDSSPWLRKYRAKCRVVPLGIDTGRFEETPEIGRHAAEIRSGLAKPVTIFVGKLRYYKGLEFLIRAMTEVPGTLVVLGGGRDLGELRALAGETGVGERCVFTGEVSEDRKIAHLHAADVFCMPSHLRSEAFGLSQIEAMACGLPVVSTNIPTGVPFVNQDGLTGFTVDPASPAALAKALNEILRNEALKQRLGAAARHRACTLFTTGKMCSGLKHVYREVLGETGPAS